MENINYRTASERAKRYGRAVVPCLFALIDISLGAKGYIDIKDGFASKVEAINGANASTLLYAPQADITGVKHGFSLDLLEFGAVEAAAGLLAAKSVIEAKKLMSFNQPARRL